MTPVTTDMFEGAVDDTGATREEMDVEDLDRLNVRRMEVSDMQCGGSGVSMKSVPMDARRVIRPFSCAYIRGWVVVCEECGGWIVMWR